jgi:hypothetical protein
MLILGQRGTRENTENDVKTSGVPVSTPVTAPFPSGHWPGSRPRTTMCSWQSRLGWFVFVQTTIMRTVAISRILSMAALPHEES